MCDECLSQFRRLRDGIHCHPDNDETNVNKAVADEVKLLKKVVAGIQHTLSSIVKETSKNDKSPLHPTPISISSRQLFNGTDACALNAESDDHRSAVNDDEFSLFMTNIDVSATERDISLMISRALNIPEPEHIDVVKLVSKWNLRK